MSDRGSRPLSTRTIVIGAVAAGLGAAIVLLLAARRQRSTELTLQHQQQVAERAEHDATGRRITELYTKAADQLGGEKAPVRLAGLYALERLGQASPDQRQTIVSVVCVYLRMPYEPRGRREGSREEEQVRAGRSRPVQDRADRRHAGPRRPVRRPSSRARASTGCCSTSRPGTSTPCGPTPRPGISGTAAAWSVSCDCRAIRRSGD